MGAAWTGQKTIGKIYGMHLAGKSLQEIGDEVGKKKSTVQGIVDREKKAAAGGQGPPQGKKRGREKILTPAQEAKVVQLTEDNPLLNYDEIHKKAKLEGVCSVRQVNAVANAAGIRSYKDTYKGALTKGK